MFGKSLLENELRIFVFQIMHDTFTLHDVFLATGPKDILSLAHDSVPFLYASEKYSYFHNTLLLYCIAETLISISFCINTNWCYIILFYYYLCNVNTMSYNWREHVAINNQIIAGTQQFWSKWQKTLLCTGQLQERAHLCPNLSFSEEGREIAFCFTNCILFDFI